MIQVDALYIVIEFWLKPMLALGLVFFITLRPSFRSAAASHVMLVASMVLLCVLLLSISVLPEWHWQILPSWLAPLANLPIPVAKSSDGGRLFLSLITVYFLGVSWILCHTLLGIKDAAAMTSNARRADGRDACLLQVADLLIDRFKFSKKPHIVISDQIQSPMVWGYFRVTVVVPESYLSWGRARLQRVLAHEFAHIERSDWLTKMVVRVICGVLWCIPFVWVFSRKINWYAEIACDDRVLSLFDCRAEYADDLLDLATDIKHSAFVLAYIRRTDLYARIHLVLDPCREKQRPSTVYKLTVIVLICLALVPMTMTRVHAHINSQSLFDIANYPLPTLVPLLTVSEDLFWTGSHTHGQRLSNKLELINKFESINKQSTAKSPINENSVSPLHNKVLTSAGVHPPIQRVEESLQVTLPKSRMSLNATAALTGDKPKVRLPDIAIRGYLPIKMVMPSYPRVALKRNITGRVIVQFDVDEKGLVDNVRIVTAQPSKIFNRTVLDAVKEFRFLPLTVDGKPIITKNVTETFVFTL